MIFRTQKYGYCARRRTMLLPILVLGLFLLSAYVGWTQVYQYFFRTPSSTESIAFTVEEGESFSSIAHRLADADVIPSAWWFRVAARVAGLSDDVRAGVTSVIPGDRSADILGALIYPSGESEVSITIPEGYTLAQIGEVVRTQLPEITKEEWDRVTGVNSSFVQDPFVLSAHKPASVDLEGYLFPDTYRFFKSASAEDVVGRMIATMRDRVDSLGVPSGDASGMTIHELLTLSSIIEREVRSAEDMDQVSDIFLKRLAIGMALQSDATVNYVINGTDPSLSSHDRNTDTPYNTYLHPGLPPGAISNPGMNALRAVWNPQKNGYFYFLTDTSGRVYYAETYDEHVVNKATHLNN